MSEAYGGPEPAVASTEWLLTRGKPLRVRNAAGFTALVWLPGAAGLVAWETAVVVGGSWPVIVHLSSVVGLLGATWAAIGAGVLRKHVEGHRHDVVTAGPSRFRIERHNRKGTRVLVDVPWSEVRGATTPKRKLVVQTSQGLKEVADLGTPAQHDEIAAHVNRAVAPLDGQVRPPVVAGWRAYVDDRGPTLRRERAGRVQEARWCAGFALLGWVNVGALAAEAIWPFVFIGGGITGALTTGAIRLARTTPRWTALPGEVVRIDNTGAGPAFRARSIELTDDKNDDGYVSITLEAVADAVPHETSTRKQILYASGTDGGGAGGEPLAEAGCWLARAAEIPFRDLRKYGS